MIAIDTSALIESATDGQHAVLCGLAIARSDRALISAGTVHETMVVADLAGLGDEVESLLREPPVDVAVVDGDFARSAAAVYEAYGKGVNPAGLNLGDCYAYALAKLHRCPLLYLGNDFALTDIESALQ